MHPAESKDLQLAREDTRKQISLKLVQIERSRRDEDVACKDLAAAQVKVATLEKQRAEIARKLESLQSDLAQLRIKADGLAMQALPDDLWRSIFLATLPDCTQIGEANLTGASRATFLLAAVSKKWRRVVLGCTTLWGFISLPEPTVQTAQSLDAAAQIILARSGDSPLIIELDWTLKSKDFAACMWPILDRISHHACRWSRVSLTLCRHPKLLTSTFFYIPTPIMKSFNLIVRQGGLPDVSCAQPGLLPWCPRLKSFTAIYVPILSADLVRISRALKVLVLQTVPSYMSLWSLLRQATHLEELTIGHVLNDDVVEGVGASDEPIILPNLRMIIGGESLYRALGSNPEKLSLPALRKVSFMFGDFSSLETLLKAHPTIAFLDIVAVDSLSGAHALEIGHARNLRSLRVLSQEPHSPDPEFWQALAPVPSTDYPAPALTSVSLAWRKGPGLSVAQNICHQLVEFAQQRCEASRSVSSSSASAEGDSGRPVRLKNISLTHREDAVVIAESLQQALDDIIRGISTSI